MSASFQHPNRAKRLKTTNFNALKKKKNVLKYECFWSFSTVHILEKQKS